MQIENKKITIFLHLPKTAGTTMNEIIRRQYRPEEILIIYGRERIPEKLIEINATVRKNNDKFNLFIGHLGFGIHKQIPNVDFQYFTLLRNPVERVISEYYYILNKKSHRLYEEISSKNYTLLNFARGEVFGQKHSDNCQLRFLAGENGIPFEAKIDNEIGKKLLSQAIKNLSNNFSVFGTLERFDESLLLFRDQFCWKNVYYSVKNSSKKKTNTMAIPKEVIDSIKEMNAFDIELYEQVNRLIDQRIALKGKGFRDSLEDFKKINQSIFGKGLSFAGSTKERLRRLSNALFVND